MDAHTVLTLLHRDARSWPEHRWVRLLLLCLILRSGGGSSDGDTAHKVIVDIGKRVVLPCGQNKSSHIDISWQYKGDEHLRLNTSGTLIIADSGDLHIPKARPSDAGVYSCLAGDQVMVQLRLTVQDVPATVTNMSVHTNSVFAIVSWDRAPDCPDAAPVSGYHCHHRRDTSHLPDNMVDLEYIRQQVPATSTQCAVYRLRPNTTYFFRVAAYNRLGRGQFVAQSGTTQPLVTTADTGRGYGRLLVICLAVSLVGLATLGSGIALLLVRRGSQVPSRPLQESPAEEEALELVPHITLNPSFNIDMLEHLGEEESSEHAFLVDHGGEGG